ncbi:hypothetical protein [Izhakiella capsodis]|nr:hypothetical protein [Izhakiella capsodis]
MRDNNLIYSQSWPISTTGNFFTMLTALEIDSADNSNELASPPPFTTDLA